MNAVEAKPDTKQRILDSAERLFAAHGFEGTSLRNIIADAKVNLAAIHYHYHSKEALLEAVVLRRLEPLNQRRLEMLDACERMSGGKPSVEAILEAFIAPTFQAINDSEGGKSLALLMGRVFTADSPLFPKMLKHFSMILDRFTRAFQNAVPELPLTEIYWRLYFSGGVMAHSLRCGQHLQHISGGRCDPRADAEDTIRRIISFAAAGFRAPLLTGVNHV
jgi:AcrR family transcriptional regulator